MPYARFVQAARVATSEYKRVVEDQWRLAAFVGWQGAASAGALKQGTTFDKYLRELGLGGKQRLASKDAATKAAERVREAFKRGVVKQA
jgi:hypothetical protein